MTLAPPASAPVTPTRRAWNHVVYETGIALRNGEQLLVSAILPVLVLFGLLHTHGVEVGPGPRIDAIMPGILTLILMSCAFTGQAIQTGFDRRYGVLRFLGTTPLGRSGLILGKAGATVTVFVTVSALVGFIALAMGWRPSPSGLLLAVPIALLGCATWVALALALAGTLRAEAVLAVSNLVWVLCVALGGVVVPSSTLPGPLAHIAPLLPSGALGDALRQAVLHSHVSFPSLLVLAAWGAAAGLVCRRWFRWGPD